MELWLEVHSLMPLLQQLCLTWQTLDSSIQEQNALFSSYQSCWKPEKDQLDLSKEQFLSQMLALVELQNHPLQ